MTKAKGEEMRKGNELWEMGNEWSKVAKQEQGRVMVNPKNEEWVTDKSKENLVIGSSTVSISFWKMQIPLERWMLVSGQLNLGLKNIMKGWAPKNFEPKNPFFLKPWTRPHYNPQKS